MKAQLTMIGVSAFKSTKYILLVSVLSLAACSSDSSDSDTNDAGTDSGAETDNGATTDTGGTDAGIDPGATSDTGSTTDTGATTDAGTTTDGQSSTTAGNGVADAEGVYDIYNAIFTLDSADCANYVNSYDAMPMDLQNQTGFEASVTVTATETECTFTSNSVPNHDFNDETAAFAGGAEGATITAQELIHTVTRNPAFAESPTYISTSVKNGIFLNGVRLDIATAGCYRPTDANANELGEVGIGCSSNDDWVLDALSTESKFGADLHNAHTQPGGLYHYHGNPMAMFDDNPGPNGSPVIGFAADGFPIYGSYFLDNNTGTVRKALSGYTVKTGSRGERSDTNPGGDYTGRYVDDWEFTDVGDLDVCNGMTVNGQYGYYVTDTYPWVLSCLSGTPHETFLATGGGGGGPPPR